MAMHLNVILVRNHGVFGDLSGHVVDTALACLGLRSVEASSHTVAGAFVQRSASTMHDAGARQVLRVTSDQGYTVLSDGNGDAALELEAWCELSARLGTRVVVARHDDLGTEFAVFDHGEMTRLASWELGEAPLSLGEPLAQECLFAQSRPEVEELVEWIGCMGVDLERMNRRAMFTLHEVAEATTEDQRTPTPTPSHDRGVVRPPLRLAV